MDIIDRGRYANDAGEDVDFLADQALAVANTLLYTPDDADRLLLPAENRSASSDLRFEVTAETTQAAARRLVQEEGCHDPVLLNYASARNPGGGFTNGAKAQEEDLCRCSGLYPCLLTQSQYYQANRAQDSLFYTDHLIYSPRVPWFRTKSRELLDQVFLASVITAPAPNAGQIFLHEQGGWADIETSLRHRAALVLAIAREHNHRTLLLGAWGCGVFRNQPETVARVFHDLLQHDQFAGCFDRVVFAVYDRSKDQGTFKAFRNEFLNVSC
ncbi:MAG: hypothetical protein JWO82_2542 [Akkermansiaceae bacterium]|nr:hypothetical protein [Akkermansiaceae bacterium]